jgi:hypothetical protein
MDENIYESKEIRRIKARMEPGPITKFFNAINPQTSLGKIAGKDFHEQSLTISLILLFTLTVAIISTVMFFKMEEFQVRPRDLQIIVAVAAISWFVFLNFTFLVFEATRMFNVLLFVFIVTLTGIVVSNLPQERVDAILGITVIALATIPLVILMYFYFASEGEEVVMLKTLERERKQKEASDKAIRDTIKITEAKVKEQLKEDVTSETGIRSKIAQAYIDQLIDAAKKPKKDEKAEKEKKEKEKKEKEKKEKEKKEEE